ncbi:hypothetical protein HT746_35750 [Burkholderia pyrrocinia]|nr:hypothetical protein [Burkholderia pyrrocinia]
MGRTTSDRGAARRRGEQRTVTPTRTRVRAAKAGAGAARRSNERGASGPATPRRGDDTGKPHWEDDGDPLPPEEWS